MKEKNHLGGAMFQAPRGRYRSHETLSLLLCLLIGAMTGISIGIIIILYTL